MCLMTSWFDPGWVEPHVPHVRYIPVDKTRSVSAKQKIAHTFVTWQLLLNWLL